MLKYLVILLAVITCAIRLFVPPTQGNWVDNYKDLAHVFVGALIPAAWAGFKFVPVPTHAGRFMKRRDLICRLIFWGLCAWEVACATISRL